MLGVMGGGGAATHGCHPMGQFPANSRVAPEDLTAVDLQLWADFPTLRCSFVGMNVIGAVLG